jgi:hypothetical protein
LRRGTGTPAAETVACRTVHPSGGMVHRNMRRADDRFGEPVEPCCRAQAVDVLRWCCGVRLPAFDVC